MMGANLYFIGNAGCGKSSLTSAFKNWMQNQGFSCATVNLDPGVEWVPYPPDIDVREWVDLRDIMGRFGVGPNGAQIIGSDFLAVEVEKIREAMEEYRVDYYLMDTPGQMELFTLRESSSFIVEALGKRESLLLFLFEPMVSKEPSGFLALLLQSLSAQFRMDLPMASFLSKADLLGSEELERIAAWGGDPGSLYEALISRGSSTASLNLELFRALETLEARKSVVPVSAETGLGLEDIYTQAQFTLFGSQDLTPQ